MKARITLGTLGYKLQQHSYALSIAAVNLMDKLYFVII